MKPTITISSKHVTLILGIVVALIVLVLMMMRSPEVKMALNQVFPEFKFQTSDAQISALKITFVRIAEIIR